MSENFAETDAPFFKPLCCYKKDQLGLLGLYKQEVAIEKLKISSKCRSVLQDPLQKEN